MPHTKVSTRNWPSCVQQYHPTMACNTLPREVCATQVCATLLLLSCFSGPISHRVHSASPASWLYNTILEGRVRRPQH